MSMYPDFEALRWPSRGVPPEATVMLNFPDASVVVLSIAATVPALNAQHGGSGERAVDRNRPRCLRP